MVNKVVCLYILGLLHAVESAKKTMAIANTSIVIIVVIIVETQCLIAMFD